MRTFWDIFSQTIRTLWAHKLRSFLTMFGIAWGVFSLLLLVGLGEGFRTGNKKELDQIGENIQFIFPGRIPAVQGQSSGMRRYYITYDDYAGIAQQPHVMLASPVLVRQDIRVVSDTQNSNGQVAGVLPLFKQIRYLPLASGRWLNDLDQDRKSTRLNSSHIQKSRMPSSA